MHPGGGTWWGPNHKQEPHDPNETADLFAERDELNGGECGAVFTSLSLARPAGNQDRSLSWAKQTQTTGFQSGPLEEGSGGLQKNI